MHHAGIRAAAEIAEEKLAVVLFGKARAGKKGFDDGSIGAGQLLLGALPPTIVAAVLFLI